MADKVITSTGDCSACCGGAACEIECQQGGTTGRCTEPVPDEGLVCVSSSVSGSTCIAFYTTYDAECDCGPFVATAQVRLNLTGLTSGHDYLARVNFISDISSTSYVEWTFTATGSTETTSWEYFPTPDATDQTWTIDGACTIEDVT